MRLNGRRRVMGWGVLGCSNLTASGARGGVARDVTVMTTGKDSTCDTNEELFSDVGMKL